LQASAQPDPVCNLVHLLYHNGSCIHRGPHASAEKVNIWIFFYILREINPGTPESRCMTRSSTPALWYRGKQWLLWKYRK